VQERLVDFNYHYCTIHPVAQKFVFSVFIYENSTCEESVRELYAFRLMFLASQNFKAFEPVLTKCPSRSSYAFLINLIRLHDLENAFISQIKSFS
jgi:hypothetical protein